MARTPDIVERGNILTVLRMVARVNKKIGELQTERNNLLDPIVKEFGKEVIDDIGKEEKLF